LIPPRPSASPTVPVGRSCTGCAQVPFARSWTVKSLAPPIVRPEPGRRRVAAHRCAAVSERSLCLDAVRHRRRPQDRLRPPALPRLQSTSVAGGGPRRGVGRWLDKHHGFIVSAKSRHDVLGPDPDGGTRAGARPGGRHGRRTRQPRAERRQASASARLVG